MVPGGLLAGSIWVPGGVKVGSGLVPDGCQAGKIFCVFEILEDQKFWEVHISGGENCWGP